MGQNKGIVMDGRDIGTVVFPEAELKIFMTASAQTRTQRRFDELTAKGEQVDFDEVYENITSRDYKDSTRADSPLTQAKDARVLDNTNLTQSQQYKIVMDWIKDLID
jgi:cytidylate kinase